MKVNGLRVAIALGALFLLGFSSFAWACTSAATLAPLAPPFGRPKEAVAVTGTGFQPGAVEIRWNTPGGALIGAAAGPNFTSAATIPLEATSDVYYIVALSRNPDGTIASKATTPVEVTAASGEKSNTVAVSADLWEGFGKNNKAGGTSLNAPATSRKLIPSLMAGVGLMFAGLLPLLVGVTVSAVRRRSAKA